MTARDIVMSAAGNAGDSKTYIEDVFSTYLYTGNGSTQTINNGIDLAGKGGMVWTKSRSQATANTINDTVRGRAYTLNTNATSAQTTSSAGTDFASFNSNGFTVSGTVENYFMDASGQTYASWTFRKAPKFFDVVTWTGNNASTQTINHSLGQKPGMIIYKCYSGNGAATGNWIVYHNTQGATKFLRLNATTAVATSANAFGNTEPTETQFTVGPSGSSQSGGDTYVAYLFAHDTTTAGLIQCGSFTTDASGLASVNLGWEAQYVLVKATATASDWFVVDTMRGSSYTSYSYLNANLSSAETSGTGLYLMRPTATGFDISGLGNNRAFIYMAIRRGPMRTPTDAAKVFYPQAVAQTDIQQTSNSPLYPDLIIDSSRNGSSSIFKDNVGTRLIGLGSPNDTFSTVNPILYTNSTSAEISTNGYIQLKADSKNVTKGPGWNNAAYGNYIYWLFSRAPGFFDVVCYTGTGAGQVVNHNLGVVPELMIFKCRSTASTNWMVTSTYSGNMYLELTNAASGTPWSFHGTAPTSTQFTTRNVSNGNINNSGSTYVAYLFASCPGVSKVGSYTGNGSSQTINCGFTNGARFVLIKRTDSTGDWYVWDTARGIVAGNDPHLSLNSTAAEVTTNDTIDPNSSGFIVNQVAATNVNVSGASYIYLAIA